MITATVAFGLLAIVIIPWSNGVDVPAVLEASDLVQIYPPRSAEVLSVTAQRGDFVQKEDPIIRLRVPELENGITGTTIKIDLARLRLARTVADRIDRDETLVLSHELKSLETELGGLQQQRDELTIRSPVSGTILELDTDLHPGRWIGKSDRIALISSQQRHVVRGYLSETALRRLSPNAIGLFIPDDMTRSSVAVRLESVARVGATSIDILELASTNGGQIAVQPDSRQNLVPLTAQYLVELKPQGLDHPPEQTVRGVVELKGAPESYLVRALRQVSKVLIRESGF